MNDFDPFQLTPDLPVATLDYGFEVAGWPIFNVVNVTARVQIEVKYSEPFAGLSESWSDGPYTFVSGLSNSYRVETFEVTKPGFLEAFLLQGGQRWQSIRLLTNGTIAFSQVGFKASISKVNVDELPGQFASDNDLLNDIWKLGARAVSAACLEKGSQKSVWKVGQESTFVPGIRPALTEKAASFSNYTLEFNTKIDRAGMGWAVVSILCSRQSKATCLLSGY